MIPQDLLQLTIGIDVGLTAPESPFYIHTREEEKHICSVDPSYEQYCYSCFDHRWDCYSDLC